MFLPPINELEHFEGNYMKNSLQNLGETIQSLLGFKKDLTFTWAESVRLIIEDLSSAVNSPDSSGSLIYLKDAKLSEKENCDLASAILKLEDELAALKVYLGKLDAKRRETLNKLLDLKGSIRVFCRVRPFVLSDKQAYPGPFVVSAADKLVIKLAGGKAKEYNFDKVFLPGASQDEIFSEVEPIIRSALDGHNVCIFAYGQTGTGKTFTMEGKPDCPGVVPHAIQELFRHAFLDRTVTFTFTFSMLEVYMGNVRDLLSSRSRKAADHKPKCLSIQMDAKGAVEIESLREVIITNPSQAIKLYGRGSRARSTAWTNANEASSRSHCLIRIAISYSGPADKYRDTSKLWMVDLGGSERLVKTQSTGQTMEEGKAINMSLSALGDVISALQKKQAHIPYRNSKLTQILRDSVGEGSRMLMLVHISPHEDDLSETICSLSFATRVRGTHLGWELSPELKEASSMERVHHEVKVQKAATMAELMQQMRCLEDDCQSARNNMQSVEFLLREKKKYLEKSDHETPELPARQVTETHNIELGNVAQGSVGLPRYMNSTACSRIRGKSSDADIKYPGSTKTREHLNSRRNSLLGSAKTVIFPEMDQSLCSSESTLSNNSVLRQSSLSIKKDLNRTYSNQYNIEESPCFAECSTPKDIGMLDNKRNSLLGSAKNVIFPEMDQSLCSSESSLSNNSVLRQSLLSNKKNSNRMYSNQYNIEESHCFSECSTPKDIVMLDNEKMNEIYSKWCSFDGSQLLSDCNMHMNSGKANNKKVNTCTFDELTCLSDCSSPKDSEMADSVKVNESRTFDESTCLSDCSTPKNSEMADNLKVNESRTSDESTCLSDCSTPKDSEMADSVKVNESFFNKCTIDVSKCFSERNMPETGLMHSSMPHSKRVIALQTAPNKTVNRDILSNNIIDKSELTVIKKIACNWPMNNKGEYDQTILWKQPSNGKEECNRSPYKQFPMQKTLKPHISREDTMTFENKISVLMAATELTTTKPAEAAPKKEITETVAKPTTGLCFPMMKIAYALGLGVGLLKVGLEDDFFNGLLV